MRLFYLLVLLSISFCNAAIFTRSKYFSSYSKTKPKAKLRKRFSSSHLFFQMHDIEIEAFLKRQFIEFSHPIKELFDSTSFDDKILIFLRVANAYRHKSDDISQARAKRIYFAILDSVDTSAQKKAEAALALTKMFSRQKNFENVEKYGQLSLALEPTLKAFIFLANFCYRQGKISQANNLCRKAFRFIKAKKETNKHTIAWAYLNFAAIGYRYKQFQTPENWLFEALNVLEQSQKRDFYGKLYAQIYIFLGDRSTGQEKIQHYLAAKSKLPDKVQGKLRARLESRLSKKK